MKKLFVYLFLLILSGCNYWAIQQEGEFKISNISVNTPVKWNTLKQGNLTTWTLDGAYLGSIHFFSDVKDGSELVYGAQYPKCPGEASQMDADKKPKKWIYKKTMTEIEVVDLFGVTYKNRLCWPEFSYSDLKKEKFGSADGFAFKFNVTGSDGLRHKGMAKGVVSEGKLNIIVYRGTELYHYKKYLDLVNQIFSSTQII